MAAMRSLQASWQLEGVAPSKSFSAIAWRPKPEPGGQKRSQDGETKEVTGFTK